MPLLEFCGSFQGELDELFMFMKLSKITFILKIRRIILSYIGLARRLVLMMLGKSYWHTSPKLEECFIIGELAGYFRDYTPKANWSGHIDQNGMPLVDIGQGNLIIFPTTVIQKALGHWGLWHRSGKLDVHQKEYFLIAARWLMASQDQRGGWPLHTVFAASMVSKYSAMTQGQAISVLVRAYEIESSEEYLRAAQKAMFLMLSPLSEGGTARWASRRLVLEEVPSDPENTILNGWIYGIFGLYDLHLVVPGDRKVSDALSLSISTLEEFINKYDSGFWSFYNTQRDLASPYYHQVHITQFQALSKLFPDSEILKKTYHLYRKYEGNIFYKYRAFFAKLIEKVCSPPSVILR